MQAATKLKIEQQASLEKVYQFKHELLVLKIFDLPIIVTLKYLSLKPASLLPLQTYKPPSEKSMFGMTIV